MKEFDEWVEENEEYLTEYAAESGADRELDYNADDFALEMYERKYKDYERKNKQIRDKTIN